MSTSSFQLTPSERPTFAHLFALADPQSTGMVNGSAAVSFFALSGLPTAVLGSIWSISDSDNNGFLGPAQFSAALRLIGHAQNGKVVTEDLVREPGPTPTFKGITIPAHLTGGGMQTPSRSSSTILQPQSTGGGGGGFGTSEIKPEDRARYTRIFASAGPQSGLLDGEKAKEIFVKSKLPFDKLGAIWNLADTKARGKLDLTDFVVGMHFIQSTMNGTLTTIPASLPAGLYEKAAGGVVPSSPIPHSLGPQLTGGLGMQHTGGSTGFISRQMTGTNQYASPATPIQSSIRSPPPTSGTPLQAQRTGSLFPLASVGTGSNWAVSPADKAKSDRFFDGLDQDRKGVLEGQAAVPFFMQSGLNEATLAHVWDLSDVTQSGSLTRDEFAVAMHLINLKITGSDLPSELPASLVPPSLRGTNLPQAVNPKETDTQRDLFSLMDDDVDLPVSTASAFAVPAPSSITNQSITAAMPASFDDDFLGSNVTSAGPASSLSTTAPTFAGGVTTLSPAMTGASNMSGTIRQAIDETTSRSPFQAPFGDASAEAGNQRLALDSTQKSLSTLESKKAELEKTVSNDANSISDLSTRLETVRMRHQTETEAVKALTQRQSAQALELKNLREESVREESELSRLKQEKDEIEQSVMKDREDVREMKRLVGERTREKEQLKVELEKIKKEARMQKGMVAIGKKQLSQSDVEVSSIKQEIEQAKVASVEEEEQQQHAEHGEVVMSPTSQSMREPVETALSPTASVKSTNPFDRIPAHVGAAAATGAGLASAAGIGAALLHHESTPAPLPTATATEDDPLGASNTTTANLEAAPPAAADKPFDDSFGQFDATAPTTSSLEESGNQNGNVNQAFDDAFADFDDPAATKEAKEPEDITSAVPGSFAAAEVSSPTATTTTSAAVPATSQAEPVEKEVLPTEQEPSPFLEPVDNQVSSDDAPLQSHIDKGKGILQDETAEDSSDEEEGPEDVEDRARRLNDSPDEVGIGKAAVDPITTTTSKPFSVPEAADRFPEISDEATTEKAPIPASSMDSTMAPFTASSLSSAGLAPIISSVHGPSSDTGGADSFHDAFSESVTGREEAELPTEGGFMNVTSHERFSTALENNNVGQRSVSPSKTRRAPPPAPIRGSTSNMSPSLNAGPFATSTAPSTTTAVAPIDDFDAAFEDLGPTSGHEAVGNLSTSTTTGFEDAFGDADGFDFVPSFGEQNGVSSGMKSTAQTGGFDGFDSAFESAFEPSPATASQAATGANVSSSGAGSGFSFEDAFAPVETPTLNQPSSVSSAAAKIPPSLPSRSTTTTTTSSNTGALPDDAAPVRQLCAMGFTRADVIKSLERSNYRTDKALERLLAQ